MRRVVEPEAVYDPPDDDEPSAEECFAECSNRDVCERLATLHMLDGEIWDWCQCDDCAEWQTWQMKKETK